MKTVETSFIGICPVCKKESIATPTSIKYKCQYCGASLRYEAKETVKIPVLDQNIFDRLKNYKTLSDNDRDAIVEHISNLEKLVKDYEDKK